MHNTPNAVVLMEQYIFMNVTLRLVIEIFHEKREENPLVVTDLWNQSLKLRLGVDFFLFCLTLKYASQPIKHLLFVP